jgi:hypothetical protein
LGLEAVREFIAFIAFDRIYEKKSTSRLKLYAAQATTIESIQDIIARISTKINNLLIKKG